MIRFSNNQPWYFGITPSEYFDEQAKHLHVSRANVKTLRRFEDKKGFLRYNFDNGDDVYLVALDRLEGGIQTLDKIYTLTLTVPNLEIAPIDELRNLIKAVKSEDDLRSLLMVGHNAKPAGCVDFKYKPRFPQWLYSEPTKDNLRYNISRVPGLLDKIREYETLYQDTKLNTEGLIIGLIEGIAFGYPVADVLECNPCMERDFKSWANKNSYSGDIELLLHQVRPWAWTEKWKQEVGMRGEEHLQAVYKNVLELYLVG